MKKLSRILTSIAIASSLFPNAGRAENFVQYYETKYGRNYIDMDSLKLVAKDKYLVYYTTKFVFSSQTKNGAAYSITRNLTDCSLQLSEQIYWASFTTDNIPVEIDEKKSLNQAIDETIVLVNEKRVKGRLSSDEYVPLCQVVSRWAFNATKNEKIQPVVEATSSPSTTSIPLTKEGGVFHVKATVNSGIALTFVVDSGAADVTLPDFVGKTLFASGSLQKADIVGTSKYSLADGSTVTGTVVNLKSLTLGDVTIRNVRASIFPNDSGSLLLGQSALQKLGKWRINTTPNRLEITRE